MDDILDIPEELRGADGSRVKLSPGDTTIIYQLRKLSLSSRLTAMNIDKAECLKYWKDEFDKKLAWCRETLQKKLTWRETGEKINITDRIFFNDCVGASCTYNAFLMRVKRGTVEESDVNKLYDFLTGPEVNIPEE